MRMVNRIMSENRPLPARTFHFPGTNASAIRIFAAPVIFPAFFSHFYMEIRGMRIQFDARDADPVYTGHRQSNKVAA